jgi:hypothetical protein
VGITVRVALIASALLLVAGCNPGSSKVTDRTHYMSASIPCDVCTGASTADENWVLQVTTASGHKTLINVSEEVWNRCAIGAAWPACSKVPTT